MPEENPFWNMMILINIAKYKIYNRWYQLINPYYLKEYGVKKLFICVCLGLATALKEKKELAHSGNFKRLWRAILLELEYTSCLYDMFSIHSWCPMQNTANFLYKFPNIWAGIILPETVVNTSETSQTYSARSHNSTGTQVQHFVCKLLIHHFDYD